MCGFAFWFMYLLSLLSIYDIPHMDDNNVVKMPVVIDARSYYFLHINVLRRVYVILKCNMRESPSWF